MLALRAARRCITSSTESGGGRARAVGVRPRRRCWSPKPDGEVIGPRWIVGWDGWRGTFYRLAVDPAHRRRGLATALVRAGEERLRALGARRLNAIVETEEVDAMAFWAAAGYELQTARSRFVKNFS